MFTNPLRKTPAGLRQVLLLASYVMIAWIIVMNGYTDFFAKSFTSKELDQNNWWFGYSRTLVSFMLFGFAMLTATVAHYCDEHDMLVILKTHTVGNLLDVFITVLVHNNHLHFNLVNRLAGSVLLAAFTYYVTVNYPSVKATGGAVRPYLKNALLGSAAFALAFGALSTFYPSGYAKVFQITGELDEVTLGFLAWTGTIILSRAYLLYTGATQGSGRLAQILALSEVAGHTVSLTLMTAMKSSGAPTTIEAATTNGRSQMVVFLLIAGALGHGLADQLGRGVTVGGGKAAANPSAPHTGAAKSPSRGRSKSPVRRK